jgi:hypothetical protein
MKFKSIVLWPDTVSTGKIPNESEDTHNSFKAAEAVCKMIKRKGLGGEGKIFPISTRIEPIIGHGYCDDCDKLIDENDDVCYNNDGLVFCSRGCKEERRIAECEAREFYNYERDYLD